MAPDLPNELLEAIFGHLRIFHRLIYARLALLCTDWREQVQKDVFRTLSLSAVTPSQLQSLISRAESGAQLLRQNPKLGTYITELDIRFPIFLFITAGTTKRETDDPQRLSALVAVFQLLSLCLPSELALTNISFHALTSSSLDSGLCLTPAVSRLTSLKLECVIFAADEDLGRLMSSAPHLKSVRLSNVGGVSATNTSLRGLPKASPSLSTLEILEDALWSAHRPEYMGTIVRAIRNFPTLFTHVRQLSFHFRLEMHTAVKQVLSAMHSALEHLTVAINTYQTIQDSEALRIGIAGCTKLTDLTLDITRLNSVTSNPWFTGVIHSLSTPSTLEDISIKCILNYSRNPDPITTPVEWKAIGEHLADRVAFPRLAKVTVDIQIIYLPRWYSSDGSFFPVASRDLKSYLAKLDKMAEVELEIKYTD